MSHSPRGRCDFLFTGRSVRWRGRPGLKPGVPDESTRFIPVPWLQGCVTLDKSPPLSGPRSSLSCESLKSLPGTSCQGRVLLRSCTLPLPMGTRTGWRPRLWQRQLSSLLWRPLRLLPHPVFLLPSHHSLSLLQEFPWRSGCHLKGEARDFPGGPAVKAPRSQRRGPGFDPWSGN